MVHTIFVIYLDWKHAHRYAGEWAEVNGDCDIPLNFVRDSLAKIAAAHPDLDAVFMTGDLLFTRDKTFFIKKKKKLTQN